MGQRLSNSKITRTRPTVIGASVTAVVVLAMVSACGSLGGTAAPATGASAASAALSVPASGSSAAGSSAPTSSSASAGSSAPASGATASSSAPASGFATASAFPTAGSSAVSGGPAASSRPAAVLGLPNAVPLTSNVLLGTRVVGGSEDLYQIDTTSGAVGKKLTTGAPAGPQFPILSPDRGSVVYVQAGGESQLRTMAVDGTGDRLMFPTPPDGCQTLLRPAWNPVDGSELAMPCVVDDGTTELNLVGVDGSVRGTLNTGLAFIDDVSYSPDGKTLMYWGSPNNGAIGGSLYLQPSTGGTPRQITSPGAANDADATFSPDGKTIVFRRETTDSNGATSSQILVAQADGSNPTAVTDGTSVDQDPTVSPDGTQIAFKSNRNNAAGTSDSQIWVIGMDRTGLRQLGIGSPGIADGAPAWGHR